MAQRWRCSTSCIVHHVTSIRSVEHYFCSSLALAQHFCLTWFLQAYSCAVHTGNVNISKMLTFLCTTGVQECIPSNFIKNIKVNVKQLLMKKNLSRQFSHSFFASILLISILNIMEEIVGFCLEWTNGHLIRCTSTYILAN